MAASPKRWVGGVPACRGVGGASEPGTVAQTTPCCCAVHQQNNLLVQAVHTCRLPACLQAFPPGPLPARLPLCLPARPQVISQVRFSDLEVPTDAEVLLATLRGERRQRTAPSHHPSTYADDVAAIKACNGSGASPTPGSSYGEACGGFMPSTSPSGGKCPLPCCVALDWLLCSARHAGWFVSQAPSSRWRHHCWLWCPPVCLCSD